MKPPYRLCWHCNRQFRGNHFAVVETETGLTYVHKQCAKEMENDGLIDRVAHGIPPGIGNAVPPPMAERVIRAVMGCRMTRDVDLTGLFTLAHNLAMAGALCASFDLGWDQCLESEHIADSHADGWMNREEVERARAEIWMPGCRRSAP